MRTHRLFIFLFLVSARLAFAGVSPGVVFNLPLNGDTNSFVNGAGGLSVPAGSGGGGAPTGTMVESGIVTAGRIPMASDTSGTNYSASPMLVTGTNIAVLGTMSLELDALAAITAPAMSLSNGVPATVGAQVQVSGALYQAGGAWLMGSASNAPVVFRQYVVPVVGGSSPTSSAWKLDGSLNNGAFVNVLQATPVNANSNPMLTVNGEITALSSITIGAINAFIWSGRSIIRSSVDGAISLDMTSGTGRSSLQANIPQITKTANYQWLALDSGLYANNIGAVAAMTNWLPSAVAGMHASFNVDAAQIVSIKPFTNATDVIRWGSILGTTNDDIWSSQVGSRVHLNCVKAGLWVVDRIVGAWTLVKPRIGNVSLVGGTITVTNSTVTANSAVLLQRKTAGGTIGMSSTYTLSAGVGFTITSDNVLDTSTYTWKLEEIPN